MFANHLNNFRDSNELIKLNVRNTELQVPKTTLMHSPYFEASK
jgi:hypothetical protein